MDDINPSPLVFVSHASEDKDRFVIPFATRLRQRGIDAWVDRWEITAGDSLVDKIFEEGLKRAAAVLIVLSSVSVNKRWVREELDASVVARINRGTRLIPILIDPVDVPEALKHTVWITVPDINNFDDALEQVVSAILRTSTKPPLGAVPPYVSTDFVLPGMNKQDSAVLKLFCEAAIAKDSGWGIQTDSVAADAQAVGIDRQQFLESAEILAEAYLLERSKVIARVSPYYNVTAAGMDKYVDVGIPGYRKFWRSVVSALVNEGKTNARDIAAHLGSEKLLLVEHVLTVLESNGLVKIAKMNPRHWHIHSISPRLKRILESGA